MGNKENEGTEFEEGFGLNAEHRPPLNAERA
jgi:hypothetical protein